jgi:hypothetical protein
MTDTRASPETLKLLAGRASTRSPHRHEDRVDRAVGGGANILDLADRPARAVAPNFPESSAG